MHPQAGVGRVGRAVNSCVLAIGLLVFAPAVASAATVQLPRGATAVLGAVAGGDDNGESVAGAGDFNADGRQDVIRGASGADPHAFSAAGSATVTFGPIRALPSANLQTSIFGVTAGDNAGQSVAGAGDVNGDGIDDVIVGAPNAAPGGVSAAGSSYVVFGAATPPQTACLCIELATLTLARGFRIDGPAANANSGISVAGAGDVNGDGRDDVIVGAPGASPGGATGAGSSYVVFGSASPANVALATLTAAQGFRIDGADVGDDSGRSVAGAGDVDGDGRDDVIVGAHLADSSPGGLTARGAAYVVRGSASPANVALASLTPAVGFRILGANAFDILGGSVAGAGDVNGDGRDDVIVGANMADSGASNGGSSYVVFGSASPVNVALVSLTLAQGFRIDGAAANDDSGYAVASARDVNGDGRDDVIVSSRLADPGGISAVGSSYVVYGSPSPVNVALASLPAAQGFRIDGDPAGTSSGFSVAGAGDVAGDGRDDVVIGTPSVGLGGEAYVVSGSFLPTLAYESTLTVPAGQPVDIQPTQLRSAGTQSLSVAPALPAGLVFSTATGRITGTPTVPGFTTHEVTLTDVNGRTGARLRVAVVNAQGPAGADGQSGATGADGTDGAVGPAGSTGQAGPTGAAGPRGPAGALGRVKCKVGKQRSRRVKVTCRVVPLAARGSVSSIRATLTRNGRVYARGGSGTRAVTLTSSRRLRRGVYRARFVVRHANGIRTTIATTLRIRA